MSGVILGSVWGSNGWLYWRPRKSDQSNLSNAKMISELNLMKAEGYERMILSWAVKMFVND